MHFPFNAFLVHYSLCEITGARPFWPLFCFKLRWNLKEYKLIIMTTCCSLFITFPCLLVYIGNNYYRANQKEPSCPISHMVSIAKEEFSNQSEHECQRDLFLSYPHTGYMLYFSQRCTHFFATSLYIARSLTVHFCSKMGHRRGWPYRLCHN